MRPLKHPYAAARLVSLQFEAAALDGQNAGQKEATTITIEDNAFVSWWKPTWPERVRMLIGVPVRVVVNSSLDGPLNLDTGSGWGTSGDCLRSG